MHRSAMFPGTEVGKVKYYCGENVVESYAPSNVKKS